MDPKASPASPPSGGQLDPKLQEAYDKVMSVPTSPVPAASAAGPDAGTNPSAGPTMPATPAMPGSPAEPSPMPPTPPVDPTMPQAPEAPVTPAEPSPTVSVASPQPSNVTVTMDNSATQVQVKPAGKKGAKISPVILVFGGLILLIAYALIWIKVFNLSVPYINP